MAFKLSCCEVFSGEPTSFINDINEDSCSVLAESLTYRMINKSFGKYFVCCFKCFRISNFNFSVLRVECNKLNLFGTHNGAKSTTTKRSDVAVRIFNGDIGSAHLHFTSLADGKNTNFIGESFLNGFYYCKVSFAD